MVFPPSEFYELGGTTSLFVLHLGEYGPYEPDPRLFSYLRHFLFEARVSERLVFLQRSEMVDEQRLTASISLSIPLSSLMNEGKVRLMAAAIFLSAL